MRDYAVMRAVIARVATARGVVAYGELTDGLPADVVQAEVERLLDDGLLVGEVRCDGFGMRAFRVDGLTDEGRALWRLVENERVWRLILGTLREADVDVSYPLLKEVCEEIVRRYVIRFIPDRLD